jgi:ribosomal protein L40E
MNILLNFFKKFSPLMQIFFRSNTGLSAHKISENMTIGDLEATVSSLYNTNFTLPHNSSCSVSTLYSENSIINVLVPVLGGGKDLTDEDKNLALSHLNVKICRDCYAKNAPNAKVCRKTSCGHSKNLRMKKLGSSKKA